MAVEFSQTFTDLIQENLIQGFIIPYVLEDEIVMDFVIRAVKKKQFDRIKRMLLSKYFFEYQPKEIVVTSFNILMVEEYLYQLTIKEINNL